jgi:hypothetical protein
MTKEGFAYFEFLSANEKRITAIIDIVDEQTTQYPEMVISGQSIDSCEILYGKISPPELLDIYNSNGLGISNNAAKEISIIINESNLGQAKMRIIDAVGIGQMWLTAKESEKSKTEITKDMLPSTEFDEASVYITNYEELKLTKVDVRGVKGYDNQSHEVTLFTFLCSEDGIDETLNAVKLDGKLVHCDYNIRPTEDPDIREWAQYLPNHIDQVLHIAMGLFDNDDDLDLMLSSLFMAYQGRAEEEMVGPILDKLRVRAIAVKEATKMNTEFQTGLPRLEAINNILSRLQEIL